MEIYFRFLSDICYWNFLTLLLSDQRTCWIIVHVTALHMQRPVISLMQCCPFITLFTHQNYFITISEKNKISEKNSCVLTQVFLMITSHILEQNCQSYQTDVSKRKNITQISSSFPLCPSSTPRTIRRDWGDKMTKFQVRSVCLESLNDSCSITIIIIQ